jgi:rubrerythrin
MSDLKLAALDVDGALGETLENLNGSTRSGFLRGVAVGSGALLAAVAAPPLARAQSKNDIAILNFALLLEYMQSVFYTETERMGALKGGLKKQSEVVGAHERAHVASFKQVLGSAAIKQPKFDFGGATESSSAFRKTAVAFEDLAVAAYKGQATRIQSKAVLAAAIGIHSVEARHAAWMRELFGITPAVNAFDQAASRRKITGIVASTQFIVAQPETQGRRNPRYTG